MTRLSLALVVHNHQPVGNFDFVFAEATEKAYDPLLEALERHPTIRMALHYTGPLLDWLGEQRPEHLERLGNLVDRGQIELLGGAYYEPILVAIPDPDKLAQIRKMSNYLQTRFGSSPTGAWLAERVWEPHLAKPLAEAGVRYTLLDDTPFKMVGFRDHDLFGSYVTEEQGARLLVFGSSTYLRYAVPWHSVDEVMKWLQEQAQAHPGGVAVMGDDGEKFGLWPGTWEHCWEKGWVERFFTALEESAEWLETRPLGEVAASQPPLARTYLPCASYREMMHWALPPGDFAQLDRIRDELSQRGREDILHFVQGGLWRSFIARYDEVNHMQKKMLRVSRKVHRMADGAEKTMALEALWAAQCNCAYWHGLFGGIYLFHIRVANYAHLIAAETMADRAEWAPPTTSDAGDAGWARLERGDVDADTREEIVLNTDQQVLVFKPSYGGALVEWDWRERQYNLLNSMTRHREGYHQQLVEAAEQGRLILPGEQGSDDGVRVKEADVVEFIVHDWYRRAALLDHFLHPEATLEDFHKAQYGEQGDFVNQPYAATVTEEDGFVALTMVRDGTVWADDRPLPLRVEKVIAVAEGFTHFTARYRLQLTGKVSPTSAMRFGVELNWGIVGGDSEYGTLTVDQEDHPLNAFGEQTRVATLAVGSSLPDVAGRALLTTSRPATLWHLPLEAISNSEAGYERVYQGTSTLLWWELALEPGQETEIELHFALEPATED